MVDVSIISRIVSGIARNIDLAAGGNALIVNTLKVGTTGSNSSLSKAILDNLINLQNGSDFATGTNAHTHDARYYQTAQLISTTSGTSGATLVAVDRKTYANITGYTALIANSLANYNIQALLDAINSSLSTAGNEKPDNLFRVVGSGDATKKMAFEVDGITTATTRTVTMPDADVNLADANNAILKGGSRAFTANQPMGGFKLTGLAAGTTAGESVRYEQAILASGVNAFAADQSHGGFKITNLADPTASQDAATKNYVDLQILGVKPKQAARVATTVNITLSGTQTIDGVAVVAGNRILVKDQTTQANNGIYVVAAGAWSRSLDFDNLAPVDEINGAWAGVQEGTTNAGKAFIQYNTVATIGVDPILFTFFNSLSSLLGGDMITVSGSTITVDLATVSGLESSNPGNAAGQLRIKLEASTPTLQINGSNELGVKLSASGGLSTSAGGVVSIVDNSTLEINANTHRIKAAGVTANELATDAVTTVKIQALAVDSTKLASNAVTTAKINANAVTAVKLNADVVGFGNVLDANNAIQTTGAYIPLTNNSGVNLAAGDIVNLTSTTNQIQKALASALATCVAVVGVAAETINNGSSGRVQLTGRTVVSGGSFTIGQRVYVSNTLAGQGTPTAPSATSECVVLIGVAVSATDVILNPQFVVEYT